MVILKKNDVCMYVGDSKHTEKGAMVLIDGKPVRFMSDPEDYWIYGDTGLSCWFPHWLIYMHRSELIKIGEL